MHARIQNRKTMQVNQPANRSALRIKLHLRVHCGLARSISTWLRELRHVDDQARASFREFGTISCMECYLRGSLDLIGQDAKIAGNLRQPYADLANLSYSFSNGSLFFRFALRGKIPDEATTHVRPILRYRSQLWQIVFGEAEYGSNLTQSDSDCGAFQLVLVA